MAASVDSPIHSSASTFSSTELMTTCHDDIPSVCMTLPKNNFFSICDSFTSLAFTSVSYRMNIFPVSIDIPLNQMESDPLVSYHQQRISSSEFITDFGEDAVVSFGKYYWSKNYKAMVKRGAKRAKEILGINVPAIGEVIWKADASHMQQGAVDTAATMGVFWS